MTPLLKFTEVPPPTSGRGDRIRFVELLKTRPGHWAQYKPGKAFSLSSASIMVQDFPGVQATCRKRDDGGYDIYARWVG